MPADYICTIAVDCRTCDTVGKMENATSVHVQRFTRKHRHCDVSIDLTNVRVKKPRPRWVNA